MSNSAAPALTSVVVVAADSGPLLQDCIGSVLASNAIIEVILVDNASTDGEVERVASTHSNDPRLRVLRNETNLGFGPACNRGAERARGDALLFLNPDCHVQGSTIASLRDIAASDARFGLLGVMVLQPDGKSARGNRRRDPSLLRAFASMTGLYRLESRWAGLAGVEMPLTTRESSNVELVEAISGACMYMTRAAFERVGGFDEGYFLHVEDLDLCRRVREAGLSVAFVSWLAVTHAQGSSSRRRPVFVSWHKHRGMWRYFRKFDPAATNPLLSALAWLGIWGHFLFSVPPLYWHAQQIRS